MKKNKYQVTIPFKTVTVNVSANTFAEAHDKAMARIEKRKISDLIWKQEVYTEKL